MATDTLEAPTLDTLEDQERKLGETARATYLAAGERKKAAKDKLRAWDQFFEERGIDPNKQIERLTQQQQAAVPAAAAGAVAGATEEVAAVPALASHVAPVPAAAAASSKEVNFIMKHATEHTQDGFTLDEIVKAAVKSKVLTEDTKEARQPFYRGVMAYKNNGTLVEAPFQRDGKMVYILPKKE